MRHYLLTRSAFGPAWDIGANRRRFGMTRAVTARLAAQQTLTDWTWVVLLDERDPLLSERLQLYGDSAPAFCPIVWMPPDPAMAHGTPAARRLQRIAAADYRAPWRSVMGPADDTVLMTRLDDDDGLALDALERFRAAAVGIAERTALMLPKGVWIHGRRSVEVRHERNAMHTLVTPPGDAGCIYDYSHVKVAAAAPVRTVDEAWGWLWVRHMDTISGRGIPRHIMTGPPRHITGAVRAAFPVDWQALMA